MENLMDIWKAGEAHLSLPLAQESMLRGSQASPASTPSRSDMLISARAAADGAAEAADAWHTGSVFLSAGATGGVIAAAVIGGCAHVDIHVCSAALHALAVLAAASLAIGGGAHLWRNAEERKAQSLRRFEQAIAQGRTEQEAIDLHLGSKLAAKLGGWSADRSESAGAPSSPKRSP